MALDDTERNNLLNQTATLSGAVYALGVQLAVPTTPEMTLVVRAKSVADQAVALRDALLAERAD